MSQTIVVEGIKTVPAVLWVAFAALVFLTLRRALAPQLDRLSNVKTPVFEMSFAEQLLDEAAAKTQGGPAPSASERRGAVSRLEHAAECLAGGRILWVDDNPEWNVSLVRLFRQLGMAVDTSLSTQEALTKLEGRSYDLIISDMRRDSEQPPETAGITLIEALGQRGVRLPVIIFAVNFDPRLGVHPAIFAYTNFVDDLVQYVIDIMERIKFRAAF